MLNKYFNNDLLYNKRAFKKLLEFRLDQCNLYLNKLFNNDKSQR